MTRVYGDDGTTRVRLDTVERAVFGVAGVVMAGAMTFVAWLTWQTHEAVGGLAVRIAVLESQRSSK